MMYPTGKLDYLYRIFGEASLANETFAKAMYTDLKTPKPSKPGLYFISNENFTTECTEVIGDCYTDRFVKSLGGKFGHTTKKGHDMIATNVFNEFVRHLVK